MAWPSWPSWWPGSATASMAIIARRYNLRTELGAYLDPLADKALLVSVYVSLGLLKVLPAWLVILVVTRDVLIVGAFILSWLMDKPVEVAPLMVSKINTAAQIVCAVAGARRCWSCDIDLEPFADCRLCVVVAILTVASGALYLRDWLRHMANG